jgi:hypothetical protein
MYAAVWLRVIDGADIMIYSIAQRQSTAISAMVKIMLIKLFGPDVIVRCNQENMEIKNIHGGTNRLTSLPGASEISFLFSSSLLLFFIIFIMRAWEKKKKERFFFLLLLYLFR